MKIHYSYILHKNITYMLHKEKKKEKENYMHNKRH